MLDENPLSTTAEQLFRTGISDFDLFTSRPCRSEGAAILLCRSGEADLTSDTLYRKLAANEAMVVTPGTVVMLLRRSEDFRVTYCVFHADIFAEAIYKLDPVFIYALRRYRISTPETRCIVRRFMAWMIHIGRSGNSRFRNEIAANALRSLLLSAYDRIRQEAGDHCDSTGLSHQAELFVQFAGLVQRHRTERRSVAFYADRLCISERYLSLVVRKFTPFSAKEFIDRNTLADIKWLLRSTSLTIQEIAYRHNFSGPSYLSRFFKRHTGQNLSAYRQQHR